MLNILIVDDDPDLIKGVKELLESEGHHALLAKNGEEAISLLEKNAKPDLVVTDIVMPSVSGIELCRHIRSSSRYNKLPIIMLSGKNDIASKYSAFKAGSDDYLTKPFEPIELLLRIEAVMSRTNNHVSEKNLGNRLFVRDKAIDLTIIELDILRFLFQKNTPVTYQQILMDVFNYPQGTGNPGIVRTHIRNIRTKIEPDPGNPTFLINIPKKGYYLNKEFVNFV